MFKFRSFALVMLLTGFAAGLPSAMAQEHVASGVVAAANLSPIDLVNINTADASALQKIKGIGKKKSQAIIKYRNANGNFKSLDELLKVKCRGINKKWLDKVGKNLTI
jgi:competence protein ComEA